MLFFSPRALTEFAEDKDLLHTSGRLAGTINASKMALTLGVNKTTITRAYDGGPAGMTLLERLRDVSGRPMDDFVEKRSA